MSNCTVPNWNLKQQIQEAQGVQGGEEGNRCSESDDHVNKNNNPRNIISPMSNKYGAAELKRENGQLGMYGIGLILDELNIPNTTTIPTKPTWKWNDTLESIVHQATSHKPMNINKRFSLNNYLVQNNHYSRPPKSASVAASSGLLKKRMLEDNSDYKCLQEAEAEERIGDMDTSTATASVGAIFWRNNITNDTTNMMACPSYDSPPTTFNTRTTQARAGSENQGQEHAQGTKSEKSRLHSSRQSRAAAIHNQSERKRRDRINQKIKALQRLVPNASKTDKASTLEEVIDYIKQLQAHIQLMSSVRNMPQMMMPLGLQHQQHQLRMSLLAARMGMGMGMGVGLGMGMGMFNMNTVATHSAPHQSLTPPPAPVSGTTPTFARNSPFIIPPMNMITQSNPGQPAGDTNAALSVPLNADPYYAFLSQVSSMNVDLYNKTSALYLEQLNQITQYKAKNSSPSYQSSNQSKGD